MAIGDIIVGLDVGASKVSCVVGQVNKFSEIEVIGYGLSPNFGIKKGVIIDPQNVAKVIRTTVEQAEDVSGLAINSAYVNIKGMNVRIEKVTIDADVEKPDDGLKAEDIYKAFSKIQISTKLNSGEQLIDIIPYQYIINGRIYDQEPVGAFCKNFSIKANVVISKGRYVESLIETLKIANLQLDGLIIETLATSNIVLMPEEKKIGVLMIDVGALHTDISVYKDSQLEYYDTIPVGGDHITNDIALNFDIATDEAEKLKRQYNLAIKAMISNDNDIKLTSVMSADDKNVIKCSDLVSVIEARIGEIFQIIRKMLANANAIGKVECVVITGQGISNIVGVQELAILTLKLNQVRICSPKLINVIKPQHTTAFGMVRYISSLSLGKHVNSDVDILRDPNFKDKIIEKLQDIKEKIYNFYKRIRKIDNDE